MNLFLAVLFGACAFGEINGRRIVGGKVAQRAAYPYQVHIRLSGDHYCGGAIIDETTIITAAQCVNTVPAQVFSVVAGTNRLDCGGVEYSVLKIRIHDDFVSYFSGNDIAILKVEPITFTDQIQPIQLETAFLESGVDCIITGWGRVDMSQSISNHLLEVHQDTVTTEICQQQLVSRTIPWVINDTNLCTTTTIDDSKCYGDSGGPVTADNKLVGILSGGEQCGMGFPYIFTRVSAFAKWIEDNRH